MNNHLLHQARSDTAIAELEPAPVDLPQLLNRCLGNRPLAERLLSNFGQRFEVDLSRLQQGMQANDSQLVAQVAHQLKGAAANLAAGGLQRISSEIEGKGRANRLDEVDGLLEQLRGEWLRFNEFRAAAGPCAPPKR